MTEATTKAGERKREVSGRVTLYSGEVAFWIMRLEGT